MTHWSVPFVGIPHKPLGRNLQGVDCWGLVYLALASQGVYVPSYAGEYASLDERDEISMLIGDAKVSAQWHRVEHPRALDVVTFRRGRIDAHVGIVVAPGRMLHSTSGRPSGVENYTSPAWSARLTGIWRHASLS